MESQHFQVAQRAPGDPVRVWTWSLSVPSCGTSGAAAIISSVGISACKASVVTFQLLQGERKNGCSLHEIELCFGKENHDNIFSWTLVKFKFLRFVPNDTMQQALWKMFFVLEFGLPFQLLCSCPMPRCVINSATLYCFCLVFQKPRIEQRIR